MNDKALIDRMRREALGRRLRALRQARGWTVTRAAEAAQLPPESLCRVELGKRWPKIPTLLAILSGLGCGLRDLFE